MLVAFPSSIAFGVAIFTAVSPALANQGALSGLIGAAILGIVAPLVSRNGGFITAPCAPAAAVMSGFAAHLAATSVLTVGRLVTLLGVTALISALLQILYGVLRAGRFIKYLPYQVVSGYLSGVAVIIATAQIPNLLGLPAGTGLSDAFASTKAWDWKAIVIGVVTIGSIVLAWKFFRKVPAAIIGLAGGIAAYAALALARPELRSLHDNPLVIGPIATAGSFLEAIPARVAPLFSIGAGDVSLIIGTAVTLSVLLSIDTLKTGVVLDAMTRSRHDSNRELVGQGLANAASFIAGGVPGAGTLGPTLVNVTSGGRTRWSGVIEGFLVLVGFLTVGSLMSWVPLPALAGILLAIAWRMFDFNMFRLLRLPSTRLDFLIIVTVIVVALTLGLIEASIVGVCLAILLFMRNQIRASVIRQKADLRTVRSSRRRSTGEEEILAERGFDALLVQLEDDLFFGTTDQLFSELEPDLVQRRYILFDFRRVHSMDFTAVHLFLQMQERMGERGGEMLFSGMPSSLARRPDMVRYMDQLGLTGSGRARIFETRDGAIAWMEERILESAGWMHRDDEPPLELADIELFSDFDSDLLEAVAAITRSATVQKGTRIFSAGDRDLELFFVRRGRVHILIPLEGGKRHQVAMLGRGEFFGEMAFLDRGARSADAEAVMPTDLFVISRDAFDSLGAKSRAVQAALFEHLALILAQRLRRTNAEVRSLEER